MGINFVGPLSVPTIKNCYVLNNLGPGIMISIGSFAKVFKIFKITYCEISEN